MKTHRLAKLLFTATCTLLSCELTSISLRAQSDSSISLQAQSDASASGMLCMHRATLVLSNGHSLVHTDSVFVGGQWIRNPDSALYISGAALGLDFGTSGATTVGSIQLGSSGGFYNGEIQGGQLVLSATSVFNQPSTGNNLERIDIPGEASSGSSQRYNAALMTLAGVSGTLGYVDATGTAALFCFPTGIAVNKDGLLLLADLGNGLVRAMDTGGTVATFADLREIPDHANVVSVVADSSNNIYALHNGLVSKITTSGSMTIFANTYFNALSMTIDSSGNLYLPESTIDPAGSGGSSASGTLSIGGGVGAGGTLTIGGTVVGIGLTNTTNGPFIDINVSGHTSLHAATYEDYEAPQQSLPPPLPNEYRAAQISKITPNGQVSTVATLSGISTMPGHQAMGGIAVDSAGNIYAASEAHSAVLKITPSGGVSVLAGNTGTAGFADDIGENAKFNLPRDIAIDAAGQIYVADLNNQAIRRINPATREVTTIISSPGATVAHDGYAGTATMLCPWGITVDKHDGLVYLTDTADHTLRLLLVSPEIVAQPKNQTAVIGSTITLSATVSASPNITSCQWYRNNILVAGVYDTTLTLTNGQATDSGTYYFVATNLMGSATSNQATVTFAGAPISSPGNNTDSGGGGGGAPSAWYLLALAALAALHLRRR